MNYNEWFDKNRDKLNKLSKNIYKETKVYIGSLDLLGRFLYHRTKDYKENIGTRRKGIRVIINKETVGYAKDFIFERGGKLYLSADLFLYGFKKVKG